MIMHGVGLPNWTTRETLKALKTLSIFECLTSDEISIFPETLNNQNKNIELKSDVFEVNNEM